ncbi:MAG: T9SS type A sorting domain-containing protein [Bacteroidetes bacterium]|nr:T9SS type A sorting domain-containing protein [Bacteroidota bacterium]
MKKIITILSFIIVSIILMASSGGITGRTAAPGETTCATVGCHNSFPLNSSTGSISITDNIPAIGYTPGQTYTINVIVSKAAVTLFGFDFEAVSSTNTTAGNITVINAITTQTAIGAGRQNITHKTNGGLTTNTHTFTFNWTAPSTNIGNVTFYTTGIAANKNGNTTGDYIYSTTKVVGGANIVTGIINGGPFCEGITGISIPFSAAPVFSAGNVFTAELSDASGSFGSPLVIGSLTSTTSGTIVSSVPLPSTPGTAYRIRVMGSVPSTTGTVNNSSLTINLQPSVANAGSNQSVCSTSVNLSANAPVSGTGIWSVLNGTATITNSTSPLTSATAIGAGTNVLQWAISNAGCSTSTSTVQIFSANPPSVANAASDQTVCTNYVTLTGNTPVSGTGSWSLVSGSGTITSPNNPTTTATNLGSGLNVFQYKITNNPCAATLDSVNITFSGTITVANAGPDQTVCSSSATLAGNTATNGAGSWSLISGTGIITNSTNPSTGVTSLGLGANIFRWTIVNGACTPVYDDVTITSVTVSASNAGISSSVCSTSSTLSATPPVYGTGVWSVTAGGASVSNSLSPTSIVTGLSFGINIFQWTVSNAPCASSVSTVTINKTGSISNSNAGPDQSVCGFTASLAANTPASGTGSWSVISGTATFANALLPTTSVTALGIGNNILRWTISNSGCTSTIDDVTISTSSVSVSNAGSSQTICSTSATLTATPAVYGVGTWSLISGSGTIVSPLNSSTAITGLGNGLNVFRWTISGLPCNPSFSDVSIDNCTGGPITTNAIPGSPFCNTTSYSLLVGFNTGGMFSGFYTAELSDATGSFTNAVAIGSGPSSPLSAVIPAGSAGGIGYRIRVINTSPLTIGSDNGNNLTINTCSITSINIDTIKGSPFCMSTSYSVSIPFTTVGSFTSAFIAELSDAAGSFTAPLTIGYGPASPVIATIPSGLPIGSNYKIRLKSNNGTYISPANNSGLSVNTCVIGIRELTYAQGINIFPNPNSGEFFITFDNNLEEVKVEIENVLGEKLYANYYSSVFAGSTFRINVSELSNSVFLLKIKIGRKEIVKRIVKY